MKCGTGKPGGTCSNRHFMYIRILFAAALFAFSVTLHAEDPTSFEVGTLKFQRPNEWQWVPVSSPMRKAQLKVPGEDPAKSADITFFHFGAGQGGDVQANAQRWLKQFRANEGAEKIETQEINGKKVTLVSTEGTFNSGMPGAAATPLPDQALLGAIVDDPQGAVFIKMTGPAPLVKKSREKFIDFIKTAVPVSK